MTKTEQVGTLFTKRLYQRNFPLALVSVIILIICINRFGAPNPVTSTLNSAVLQWSVIISAVAMLYGQIVLFLMRSRRLITKKGNKKSLFNDATFFGTFVIVFALGAALPGGQSNPTYANIFQTITLIETGIISLRCVYHVWTSFRVFSRVSSAESIAFMIAWFITSLRELTSAVAIMPQLTPMADWLLMVPNMAVTRTIIAAAGIGSIVLGIRALVGREPGLIELEVR
jgi:hypothetical protein